MIHSSKPQQSFELGTTHLHGVLRVDEIQNNTLVQLVQHWGDPAAREEVLDALDELHAVVTRPAREGELDAALEQVADVACMDTPQVEVSISDVRRLHAELSEVLRVVTRFGRRSKGAAA